MPIIRIDDEGNNIQEIEDKRRLEQEALRDARRELRRKKAGKSALKVSILFYSLAVFAFMSYDHHIGIFLATVPATVLSALNLLKD